MQDTFIKKPHYQRILLKLSGEALQPDDQPTGIDASKLADVSMAVLGLTKLGVQVALVIGGGNLVRGEHLEGPIDRVTADQMGMLATVMNGLALRDALMNHDLSVEIMSAFAIPGIVKGFCRRSAISALTQGRIVIFVGGTGNPLVTTDSAAALRGIEIGADLLIKATKVDGIFSEDPIKNPHAVYYPTLTYSEVIEKRLKVMDLNAILLCQTHGLLLQVLNMNQPEKLFMAVSGDSVGTMVHPGENYA